MAYEISYKCDECGRQRQEANHWFVAMLRKRPGAPAEFGLRQMQATESPGKDGAKLFLCGMECLLKALNRFIVSLQPKPVQDAEKVTTQ